MGAEGEGGGPPRSTIDRKTATRPPRPEQVPYVPDRKTSYHPTPEMLKEIAEGNFRPPELPSSLMPPVDGPDPLSTGPSPLDSGKPEDSPIVEAPEQVDFPEASKERVEEVAKDLLDKSTEQWQAGLDLVDVNNLSDAQFQLYVYRQLKNGFPEGSYTKDGSEGKGINLTVTDTKGVSVDLHYLTEGKTDDDGKRVYACTAKDPADETKTITVDVTGDELAKQHLAKAAKDIQENFSGTEQKIVSFYAEDSTDYSQITAEQLKDIENSFNPSTDSLTDTERRTRSLDTVGGVLQRQKVGFRQEMEEMRKNAAPGVDITENKEYQTIASLEVTLDSAHMATGPMGAITSRGVLEQVREFNKQSGVPQLEVERLLNPNTEAGKEFAKEVAAAEKERDDFFDSKNVPPEKRTEYKNALEDPREFCKLVVDNKDADFTKMSEELTDKIYGNLGEAQVNSLYQNLLDTSYHLDTETRGKLEKFFTENKGKKIGILALILAAIPVAAAALTAAAAFQTVGAAGGMAGGRR